MTTVARWARRQLRLLTHAAYRDLPPEGRRGRHRTGTTPGVAFELRVSSGRG
jgi:hypothetical protein